MLLLQRTLRCGSSLTAVRDIPADCDADGQLDFYGLQTLICREMVEAGEVQRLLSERQLRLKEAYTALRERQDRAQLEVDALLRGDLTDDDLQLIDAELDKHLHTWLFYKACEQTSFLLSIAYGKP